MTLAELAALRSDPLYTPLVDKIISACAIKAVAFAETAGPTAAQITWAKSVLANPKAQADQVIYYVLAANASATAANVLSADDASIQTAVNAAVDNLLSK